METDELPQEMPQEIKDFNKRFPNFANSLRIGDSGLEKIDLDYIVSFEDGFRPLVKIYGIDSQTGVLYGANAYFGVEVKVGYIPNVRDGLIGFEGNVGMTVNQQISLSQALVREEEKNTFEEKLIELAKERGENIIKINSPDHIGLAAHRHRELYEDQFKSIVVELAKCYGKFAEAHPTWISGQTLDSE